MGIVNYHGCSPASTLLGWGMKSQTTQKIGATWSNLTNTHIFQSGAIGWGRNTNHQVIQAVTVLFPGWWLPTLSPIIMEVENGCIWKVSTIGAHFHFHDYGWKGNLWRGHLFIIPKMATSRIGRWKMLTCCRFFQTARSRDFFTHDKSHLYWNLQSFPGRLANNMK